MGVATAIAASLVGSAVAAGSAGKAAKRAGREASRKQREIRSLENSRQKVINPYASVKDLSSMATDLSGMISNPYENLGVATKASEIQMEQSDIALANTLDTLRATGASAGGATALAQAALQSKNDITANIEQQEAANEKLRAQGELQQQQEQMSEARRLQGVKISEGQRMQQAEAAGKQFVFGAQEDRTNAQLDRLSGQESQARANQASASAAKVNAISSGIGAVGSIASAAIEAEGK